MVPPAKTHPWVHLRKGTGGDPDKAAEARPTVDREAYEGRRGSPARSRRKPYGVL